MRVLILGGDGMLGHRLGRHLEGAGHEVVPTFRGPRAAYGERPGGLAAEDCVYELEVRDRDRVVSVLAEVQPEAVVNCVGIVKQRPTAQEAIPSLEVNALFPHRLAELCRLAGTRLVHLSTDCVFRGDAGPYAQDAPSDATDLYGRTKALGEVDGVGTITLRTSILGLELKGKASLIEWFLAARGRVKGFRKALYTGFTTAEMSRIITGCLGKWRGVDGVWNVASEPIDKYDLLSTLARELGREDLEIEPDDDFVCDRRLDGGPFREATGYRPPSWGAMLAELAGEIRAREGEP